MKKSLIERIISVLEEYQKFENINDEVKFDVIVHKQTEHPIKAITLMDAVNEGIDLRDYKPLSVKQNPKVEIIRKITNQDNQSFLKDSEFKIIEDFYNLSKLLVKRQSVEKTSAYIKRGNSLKGKIQLAANDEEKEAAIDELCKWYIQIGKKPKLNFKYLDRYNELLQQFERNSNNG